MSLDVSRIVNVNISTSPLALARAGFGVLNIVGINAVIPQAERIRSYDTIDDVAEDFGTSTEEYIEAGIFFSQAPRPTPVYISRRFPEATSATIFGSETDVETTLTVWQAISDGSFSITLDAGVVDTTSLDFSSILTMDEVATVIDASQIDFSVSWDGSKLILVDDSAAGSTSTVTFATPEGTGTDISGLTGWSEASTGAYLDQGVDAETITESLTAIEELNSRWYGFAFTSEVRDGSITTAGTNKDCIDAGAWAEARTKLFANCSSDVNVLLSTSTTDIAYELEQLSYSRTFTAYSEDDYLAVSIFARGATVDFSGTDTTITYKFKTAPGISPTDLSSSQADAVIAKNCNYYTEFGTQLSGDAVPIVAEGVVASGVFIDEIVGIDWLENAIQTAVFNYLYQNTTKVPQTDEGVAGIQQALEKELDQAVNNGLAAPGEITLDGTDIFLDKGYLVITTSVNDQSQSSREAREAPPIAFIIKGAGAIHSVTITGTFVR